MGSLYIYKVSDYEHRAETEQFDQISEYLFKVAPSLDGDIHLVGNFNIGGVELDALLLSEYSVRLLEFKNWGGNIFASENGDWTADGKIVKGGANSNPFEQARTNKSRMSKFLGTVTKDGEKVLPLSTIIFYKKCKFDDRLSDPVHKWLTVCDSFHMKDAIPLKEKTISPELLERICSALDIKRFEIYPERGTGEPSALFVDANPGAADFFMRFGEILMDENIPVKDAYRLMYTQYRQLLDLNTRGVGHFKGPYPQTDYLLRENNAPNELRKTVNDFRGRYNRIATFPEDDLRESLPYDLKALCEFVALVYGCQVPEDIVLHYPPEKIEEAPIAVATDVKLPKYIRVTVDSHDKDSFEGTVDDGGIHLVKVSLTTYGTYARKYEDFNYMLSQGSQVNVIRPQMGEDGIIRGELLIYDPDYLVSVTTITRCMTEYIEDYRLNLINKLKPFKDNFYTLLGVLSGVVLDEVVKFGNTSYKSIAMKFYSQKAIGILTLPDSETTRDGYTMHDFAKVQMANIQKAVADLEAGSSTFRRSKVILEPSFFSEMLGIQGRIDLMQLDHRLIMEQKSGKKFSGDGKTMDDHYAQLLLYALWNHYTYNIPFGGMQLDLLYSKYDNPLVNIGTIPDLVSRSIRMRNRIAWAESVYSIGGFRQLEGIDVDSLLSQDKEKERNDRTSKWNRYRKPEFMDVLNPVHEASELEKAYYYAFQTFVSREHYISKVGDGADSRSLSSVWQQSEDEKKVQGNIYDDMVLRIPEGGFSGPVQDVTFLFSERDAEERMNIVSNFRVGDVVAFYAYRDGDIPDLREDIVFRGSVLSIDSESITLRLRVPQSDGNVFMTYGGSRWAVEHDVLESSFDSLYRGMHSFLSAPVHRRNLILFKDEPVVDEGVSLVGDYGDFGEVVLRAKRARDIFLIIGPPGTGKTSRGMMSILKEQLLSFPDQAVLLLAYTNRAVDEICKNLVKDESLKDDFIRLGSPLSCNPEYQGYLLDEIARNVSGVKELRERFRSKKIFVSTVTSMTNNLSLLSLKRFSLAIVDEATQILEPQLMGILSAKDSAGDSAIPKIVLIGDHKQLPAIVTQSERDSKVTDPILKDILSDCRLSLFERFLSKYRGNPDVVIQLESQGRMHPDVSEFSNCNFYGGRLRPVPTTHQKAPSSERSDSENAIVRMLSAHRVSFVTSQACPLAGGNDKVNTLEASMIASTVGAIYEKEKGSPDSLPSIGVIVPYRNQIAEIRNTIATRYPGTNLDTIPIDTVERFQGGEYDYIVYGFTVRWPYQLRFLCASEILDDGVIVDRKLNVALTRARERMVLIGNPDVLCNSFVFGNLMEYAREKGCYFDVDGQKYADGDFDVPEVDSSSDGWDVADFILKGLPSNVESGIRSLVGDAMKAGSVSGPSSSSAGTTAVRSSMADRALIGYGRARFLEPVGGVSPRDQVLIYCYYMMGLRFLSHGKVLEKCDPIIRRFSGSLPGGLRIVDIGCGPCTCALSFAERFLADFPEMKYVGVEPSPAMREAGERLLESCYPDEKGVELVSSLSEIGEKAFDDSAGSASCVVFNLSYLFTNIRSEKAEEIATFIRETILSHPKNKYIVIVQQGPSDVNLDSYKVFSRTLSPVISRRVSSFGSIPLEGEPARKEVKFAYEIFYND